MTADKNVHLIICDDQAIVCEGLRAIFDTVPGITVDGMSRQGEEAVDLVGHFHPDIILMDLKMPVMDGIQATRIIRERYSDTKVIVLTTYDTEEWIINAIRSGASGYILKDTPKEELVQVIFDTVEGKHHIDPQVAGKIMNFVSNPEPYPYSEDQQKISALNDREREVLRCLGHGFSNAEIANTLFLSEGTVKNYISSILAKLGVNDRTQAALFAAKLWW